ncbi:UDP-N-acetylmuramoyl-L-alanyl-D-glutamate--2,6-diaminopimelate ligase [Corynebacterium auris]|uniref:UDP-N-acetylmuramoyl-L-alanyl-D-glutamate--2, 6-diaminopimelate ligase n=1 Tax=Corynebacterium auris TaxID=44750 RepID=UPI0025B5B35A|nr:UDP-N-acetylmuramoyl-L-alanyl-D-glutamate--2,6-diaminopimelate ligase [Corynebacterium auris]WJY68404.1 UDP-N-acetylmuramoyl-L-alanyl-D-glutamate--2,6-diaminopimelate ligase [Corynebacterium auris]
MKSTPSAVTPTLGQLAAEAGAVVSEDAADLQISSVSLDSGQAAPGGLFAALPGTRVHGATYAAQSAAAAILTDAAGREILAKAGEKRPVLVVEDVRAVLGRVSARVYGQPSKSLTLLGVTGTSGKTTTTYLLEQGLIAAGCEVGLIGTTGTRIRGRDVPTSLTTPEAPTLQALFAQMLSEGVTHVVMEVSSHALSLGRVDGSFFDVAGFTNLSQDHLDFHPTMEDYFEAKARFFDPASPVHAARSVVCVDDAWGERMLDRAGEGLAVGTRGQAVLDCSATLLDVTPAGAQHISLTLAGAAYELTLPLPGAFNVANAALATAMAHAAGVDVGRFVSGLENAAVPGRMERIDAGQDFVAVVDYAHKPAAVAAALETLRGQVAGRVGVVIGAGGDRDASKRPLMGREAAQRADLVIVTDDNPRTEDPAAIRAAVIEGAAAAGANAEIRESKSRAEAIEELIAWARPGDAVIVVGKGHEVGQIVGTTTHPFDDRKEMRRALSLSGYGEHSDSGGADSGGASTREHTHEGSEGRRP